MQIVKAPTVRAYAITVICLGVRYQWFGMYASDWDAIDSVWKRFPQADRVIPRRIPTAAH